jgi:hypothetical protein
MVDVLHAYFEEDYTPYFEEGVQVKGKMREAIYSTLYHEEYKWRIDDTTTASMSIPEADGSTPQAQREPLREAPRYTRMPSEGMAASAVNPVSLGSVNSRSWDSHLRWSGLRKAG